MATLGIGPEARRRLGARRTAEIVADELRRQIVEGQLADGDLLPRQEVLVEQFGVSLVSLREALRILETEGLVSVRRGNRGGAVVHAPAKANAAYMLGLLLQSDYVPLADLGTALQELEPICAAFAARRPDRNETLVPRLREINAEMAANITDGARFTEIGGRFHDELVRGCGNHTMTAVVGSLETLWTGHLNWWAAESAAKGEYPALRRRRIAMNVHHKLVDAIEAGDTERARKLAAKHLAATQAYFQGADPEQRIVALSPQALARRRH
ncbi:Pyruvate dehydrogenase complex repressor [Mycolicibacterium hassiacum DSM 44199]|jgi:DNA-binding FadR family transcriptional regulator|uniref:FadR/GntR family transcriptional regulator n=1 Tax=Mycolicibacterium hassiacum TaxID=46351 RepID=UPI000380B0CB|nr:FCD domain-containing protein [Mycolicibacterium hassiacum]MBX5488128.1 FadR family transcriptional regulator [Mycolicibacterium hassiacum]MDA4088527.1 GntR family transcriptional regulator [Mycolicibacterium hassiacum DSM 44199]PZN20123.1 MAG: FadR family transcriptional regulator [Mycolicibacterium hassiacum]VCT90068.1 Pyruvate dehydrogenase complex repressor [Mycolicibacterium hassiacum DSM 44199]